MTSGSLVDNVVLDSGGSNQMTLYSELFEEVQQKILSIVKRPVSKANRASGPSANKVLDLLRIEQRFTVTGHINSADITKFKSLFNQGGPFSLAWDSASYSVNIERYSLKKDSRENDERPIMVTFIVGGDL